MSNQTKTKGIPRDEIMRRIASEKWLWPDRFAIGLNLIVGDFGAGKSLLTCYLTACVTTLRRLIYSVTFNLCNRSI